METQLQNIISKLMDDLNVLVEAETIEDACYGLITYYHNGMCIMDVVLARFAKKQS